MSDRPLADLLSRRTVYDGRIVHLGVEKVRLPNGVTIELEVIRHAGAAAMVPIDDSGDVLLVRQYRHATGGWLLEVPAGTLGKGERPKDCAARELEEEVGRRAGELIALGSIWTTPGFTDERIWLYLARRLEPVAARLDTDEVLEVERMPLGQVAAAIQSGEISDAKSIAALVRALAWLQANP
jgi:ADP-ribose pyrophosphatase